MKLSELVFRCRKPLVFKGVLKADGRCNSALLWSPHKLSDVFKDDKFTFRVGKKTSQTIQFENECGYVEASVGEFERWLNGESEGAFAGFDPAEYWAYADYKYMLELLSNKEPRIDEFCVDWSEFGFEKRNAKESTLWIGSSGAYTPCHFDTYGYNLVAQIYGRKRWVLFGKEQSAAMYPTRVPFEESTVYSRVDIRRPDLTRFPKFKCSQPHVVELEPGDVLYVPNHWWHFVQSLTESISINTWVELKEEDDLARLKEIASKSLVQAVMESNMLGFERWINSSEEYVGQSENMSTLAECVKRMKEKKSEKGGEEMSELEAEERVKQHSSYSHEAAPVDFNEFLAKFTELPTETLNKKAKTRESSLERVADGLANAVTNPNVIDLVVQNLIFELS